MFDPNRDGVAGGKAVGRWHDGMLGRDDFISSRDFDLRDETGCGRG